MKNIFFPLLACLLLILTGCYKDKGNYDYHSINEVADIRNINDVYSVLYGDTLRINPVLKMSIDSNANVADTNRFGYQWISYKGVISVGDTLTKIVATTPTLKWVISLKPDTYTFYLKVTDKVTGVAWQKRFTVKIQTMITRGLLILNDVNGKARLDMLSYFEVGDTLIKDVLAFTQAGMPEITNPKALRRYSVLTGDMHYILGDQVAYKVDNLYLKWKSTYTLPYDFVNAGSIQTAQSIVSNEGATNFCVTGGNLYFNYAPFGVPAFSLPLNRIQGSTTMFHMSPYLALGSGMICVMYDEDGKRFVAFNPYGQKSESLALPDNFTTGLDLIWMGDTQFNQYQSYGIVGDRAKGIFKLYRFTPDFGTVSFNGMSDISSFPEIGKATSFAISSLYGSIIYAVDGKIYQGDVFTNEAKLMVDLGNEKVTSIYVPMINDYSREPLKTMHDCIMVSSYDPGKPAGSNGTIRQYKVEGRLDPLTLVRTITGVGKVVEMSYKK